MLGCSRKRCDALQLLILHSALVRLPAVTKAATKVLPGIPVRVEARGLGTGARGWPLSS